MLPKLLRKKGPSECFDVLGPPTPSPCSSYDLQYTSLPYPVIENVIKTAGPALLFKLGNSCKYFRQWIYRVRGLAVDTLVLTRNYNRSKLRHKLSPIKVPRIFHAQTPSSNRFNAVGVVLVCDLADAKCVRLLQNVTVSRTVLLWKMQADKFPETKLLRVEDGCELRTVNCKLDYRAWEALFEVDWAGFECKSKRHPPATDLLTEKLTRIRKIDINLNYFAYDEMLNLCEWKQDRPIKELVIQHFFSGIQPKLLVQFFEEKMDVDSSIWINYHPAVSKHEVDLFQKSLIKWMNKMGGDWAMVGHKNKKRRLLIKIGHGSGNEVFEKKFCKYVKQNKQCIHSSSNNIRNDIIKTFTGVCNQIKQVTR